MFMWDRADVDSAGSVFRLHHLSNSSISRRLGLRLRFFLLTAGTVNGAEKASKDNSSRGFRELKEALKILESLKNMTVEQLWTGGSPTSPTSAEPASTTQASAAGAAACAEKPTKEKRFLDDIKKLQENLRKTLDNVAIVEEEKMEAVVGAGGSAQVPEVGLFARP